MKDVYGSALDVYQGRVIRLLHHHHHHNQRRKFVAQNEPNNFLSFSFYLSFVFSFFLYLFSFFGFGWPLFFYLHQSFTVLINYLCILDTTFRILDTQWNYMIFDFMIFRVFFALVGLSMPCMAWGFHIPYIDGSRAVGRISLSYNIHHI